jgi:hypothetical protein
VLFRSATDWTPQQIVAAGDAATGTTVLAELWRDLAEGHDPRIDLDAVLRGLDARTLTAPFPAAPIPEAQR